MNAYARFRTAAILILGLLLFLLVCACSPLDLLRKSGPGRYIEQIQKPLADFARWSDRVLDFYQKTLQAQDIEGICDAHELDSLIDEGEGIVKDLRDIEPPSVIAGPHQQIVAGGERILEALQDSHRLLCEEGDVAAAKRSLEEMGGKMEELSGWMEQIRGWLQDQ